MKKQSVLPTESYIRVDDCTNFCGNFVIDGREYAHLSYGENPHIEKHNSTLSIEISAHQIPYLVREEFEKKWGIDEDGFGNHCYDNPGLLESVVSQMCNVRSLCGRAKFAAR